MQGEPQCVDLSLLHLLLTWTFYSSEASRGMILPSHCALQSCFWPSNGIEGLPSVDEALLQVEGPIWSVYDLTSLLRKHNARLNLVLSVFSLPNATWIVLLKTYMSRHDTSSVPWASSQSANSFSLFCQLSNSARRWWWLLIRTKQGDQLHWVSFSSQGRNTLPLGHCLSCPMSKHCTDLLTTWREKKRSKVALSITVKVNRLSKFWVDIVSLNQGLPPPQNWQHHRHSIHCHTNEWGDAHWPPLLIGIHRHQSPNKHNAVSSVSLRYCEESTCKMKSRIVVRY